MVLMAVAFFFLCVVCEAQPGPVPHVVFEIDSGLCTLQAREARLEQVLRAVARAADFELRIGGELDDARRSWSFEKQTIERVIRRLARDYSTIMLYHPPTDDGALKRLATLWIYSNKPRRQAPSISVTVGRKEGKPTASTPPDESSDPELRQVERLEGLTGPGTVGILTQALRSEPNQAVRRLAVESLARIGGAGVLPSLEVGLGDDAPSVRMAVVSAIGNIPGQRAMLALAQTLMGDLVPQVRAAAVRSLEIQAGPAARSFVEAAAQDRHAAVRAAADQVLSNWNAQSD